MRKNKTIKRAYLTDVNLYDVISRHIELVTSPTVRYEWVGEGKPDDRWGVCMGEYAAIVEREGKRPPRKLVLVHKYKFLIQTNDFYLYQNQKKKFHLVEKSPILLPVIQ